MQKNIVLILLTCLLLVSVSPALAYIGPGAGISVVGSLLSILATIIVAIGAIIFWPLRKYMKRRRARHQSVENRGDGQTIKEGTNDIGSTGDT